MFAKYCILTPITATAPQGKLPQIFIIYLSTCMYAWPLHFVAMLFYSVQQSTYNFFFFFCSGEGDLFLFFNFPL